MVVQPMNNAKAEDKKSVDSREKKRKIRDQSPVIFPHILHLIGLLFFPLHVFQFTRNLSKV